MPESLDNEALFYHRLLESIKFGKSLQTYLGDPAFSDVSQVVHIFYFLFTQTICLLPTSHCIFKRRIRRSLSLDLAKQIAVALFSSKLDYCNSLFHNMPEIALQ